MIPFQELNEVPADIPVATARFCKSDLNIIMVILGEDELFFPTEFREWSRLNYSLITAEQAQLPPVASRLLPWPKAFGLVGYVSSYLYEQTAVILPLEQGVALLDHSAWMQYCSVQELKMYPSHHIVFRSEEQRNVISLFSKRVIQRLPSIVDFPPLPISAERLIKLKRKSSPNVEELILLIERDQLLTAQVILWARSPLYGPRSHVTNVRQAVLQVLGYDLVMNLCLSLAMKRTLHHPMNGPLGWEKKWHESYLTAILAREIAIKRQLPVQLDLVTLAGLLHDIGYFVLGQYFQPHFKTLAENIEANPKTDPCLIEFNNLHFTHQHLGAWLLKNWNFPYEVVTAVQWHHSLQPATFNDDYPYCVFLARYFLTQHGFGDEFKVPHQSSELGLDERDHDLIDELAIKIINRSEDLQNGNPLH
jgi:putative nucleotidyltransferase with HDIG domain